MKISIAIVDDNHFLIKTIKEKLSFFKDLNVKYTAKDGEDCIEKVNADKSIDLILMDIEMPKCNGIEACYKIKQMNPKIKIIMLTVFDNDDNIFKAIQAGADGYLLKDTSPQELYDAIQQTMQGGAAMTPSIAMKTLNLLRNPIISEELTEEKEEIELSERETEVLQQLVKGLPYTSIAENLFISPATVRKHIENIYKKLQVHSKIEALEQAKRRRLI